MEHPTIHTKKHPLLARTDVTYRVAYDGATPKRLDLVATIAKKEKGTIVVRHIYPLAGQHVALVHASVYSDDAVANAVEQPKMLAKQKPAVPKVEAE